MGASLGTMFSMPSALKLRYASIEELQEKAFSVGSVQRLYHEKERGGSE
jgi:hypothetical protein